MNQRSYRGGHTHSHNCSLSEIQIFHKDVVIDANSNQEVKEVDYYIPLHERLNQSNSAHVLGPFDIYREGGSFISKRLIKSYLPQILKCLIPCAVTEMAYRRRRDSGHRLVHRYARHIIDVKYSPRRISDIKMMKIDMGDTNLFAFG